MLPKKRANLLIPNAKEKVSFFSVNLLVVNFVANAYDCTSSGAVSL